MTMTSEFRDQALRLAGSLEPETMTGEQAAAAVQDLATAEHATANALLFLALRVARSHAWKGHGFATAADWLAAQLGISVREAAGHLGTAKKADRLPKTKEAMKKGDLSPDQAGAVADGATADPGAEDDLLDSAARDTNKALKDKAAKAKAAATDSAARERRIRSQRSVRRGTDAEGAFWVRIYGPGMDAATFEATIRPFEELLFRHGRTNGERDTYDNRSYDAFFAMLAHHAHLAAAKTGAADAYPETDPESDLNPDLNPDQCEREHEPDARPPVAPVVAAPAPASPNREAAHGPAPARGSPSGGTPPGAPPWNPERPVLPPARLPGGNNVKVIVTVDHTALLRGHTVAGETCEIAGVGPISVAAAREILRRDPFLAVVVRKGRDVVNVAHHGRGLNAHQRTAIEAGGLRCSNQACNRSIAIQIDHRTPYATEQVTALPNQDPLCPNCHRLKTHHGHLLASGTGPRRFLAPQQPSTSGRNAP